MESDSLLRTAFSCFFKFLGSTHALEFTAECIVLRLLENASAKVQYRSKYRRRKSISCNAHGWQRDMWARIQTTSRHRRTMHSMKWLSICFTSKRLAGLPWHISAAFLSETTWLQVFCRTLLQLLSSLLHIYLCDLCYEVKSHHRRL